MCDEAMKKWRVQSPEAMGFYPVVTPDKCTCQVAQMYRLNLPEGAQYELFSETLEMHPVLISGKASLEQRILGRQGMERFDAFYIPAHEKAVIKAEEECVFYIGAASFEGIGEPHFRKFEKDLPIGDIHQIHGEGRGRREVMFTLAPQDSASRLICGLTWGEEGGWTSWPPHQHEKYLEEIYCYFDMPKPSFGFHISYAENGDVDNMVIHPVYSGTVVQAPYGYHPTAGSPGSQNKYLWVLAAFHPNVRRYDLAVSDLVRA